MRPLASGTMTGYSGTPLAKKLGIKEGSSIALVRMPDDIQAELEAVTKTCRAPRPAKRSLAFVFLFVTSQAELQREFPRWANYIADDGCLWIGWPKKTSGVASDLGENQVRDIGLDSGLVDVKVCAVNEVWSGLKFMIRVKDRT